MEKGSKDRKQLNVMATCEYFLDGIYRYPPDS
jgi:hypothetical protein